MSTFGAKCGGTKRRLSCQTCSKIMYDKNNARNNAETSKGKKQKAIEYEEETRDHTIEVRKGHPPITIPLARGFNRLFDTCTMRVITTAVEDIERAAHVLDNIANTINIDAVISSFREERLNEFDAQIQDILTKHPRAMVLLETTWVIKRGRGRRPLSLSQCHLRHG
ncbi:hypothetical protein RI054_37g140110 [Pseudoscourfieldia marina]